MSWEEYAALIRLRAAGVGFAAIFLSLFERVVRSSLEVAGGYNYLSLPLSSMEYTFSIKSGLQLSPNTYVTSEKLSWVEK